MIQEENVEKISNTVSFSNDLFLNMPSPETMIFPCS